MEGGREICYILIYNRDHEVAREDRVMHDLCLYIFASVFDDWLHLFVYV